MADKNLLQEDVQIPECVQRKAEEAFSSIKKDGEKKMKKEKNHEKRKAIVKWAAVAALAVIVTGVCAWGKLTPGMEADSSREADNAITRLDKMFTLQVEAAELEKGHAVPLILGGAGNSWVVGGEEDGKNVNFCFETPFTCIGEGIESISYSINDGLIQVIGPQEDSIIIDGEEFDGELNTGSIGGDMDEKTGEFISDIRQYKSITVSYDRQSDDHTWISICNKVEMSPEDQELLFADVNDLETQAKQYAKLVGDVVITCTVHYTDGTEEEAKITMGTTIMTYEEAGQPAEDPKQKALYMTFELQ